MFMQFIYDDGGRAAAGHTPKKDCVTRSIAIATGKPYQEVYNSIARLSHNERRGKHKRGISHPSTGVYKATLIKYMNSIGWQWKSHASCSLAAYNLQCSQISCPLTRLHMNELPGGRLVVAVSRHLTAVINGVMHDTHDGSHNGLRCVYGFFKKREDSENPPARII